MKNFALDGAPGIDVRAASMARSPSAMLSDNAASTCKMIPTDHELLGALTPREREAVLGCAKGESLKRTALRMGVKWTAVKNLRHRAMDKLGIHDIAGITRFAIRTGLIQP